MTSQSPLLEVRNLSVSRGNLIAVSDISLDLPHGKIVGLYGDSGSGKTTILRALMGLDETSTNVTGKVWLGNEDVSSLPPERRSALGMSIVLQDLGIFDDRSVFENLAYPLRRRKMSEASISVAVEAALAQVQIDDLSARSAKELSGGQRQRVALARAISYDPRVLLLDEPLRGLQTDLKLQILALIRASMAPHRAVLFVTHDQQELEVVADSVIILSKGRIVDRECRQPQSSFDCFAPHSLIPTLANLDGHVRAANLRWLNHGEGDSSDGFVDVQILDRRLIQNGTVAFVVRFRNSECGIVKFDPEHATPPNSENGWCSIGYKVKGNGHG